MATLKDFVVFDKLAVHNLTIEPKRVKAAYTLHHADGTQRSTELVYSYNDKYFTPGNYEDVNLASMMVAQVALNYGLFCKEIQFDGVYDAVDKRFLQTMLENTSREIITNKLLIDNEFLLPDFKQPIIEKQATYTAAQLTFTNTAFSALNPTQTEAAPDHDHYAILSSGGKDSLLSYGMVKEFGEAHPVFINESGRHWFTAINAHRHFKEIEPNTAKPWCNSDRLFNWMVRQMPFIREDFQNIRADIYPIRLWTVAVFLFGVLPVARKRNVGNILIGNEYDTTETGTSAGIKHYNGLYDQSKYFDNALTRYYRDKKWHIHQFSILRSLSEMLIMKALVKRYPDLQKHQVSCHAAHEKDQRMYPCGNCEKCRRIIGMLIALDEDPKRCGYTDEQIKAGLDRLGKKGVKQIGSDAAHLYHLLLSKHAIESNDFTQKSGKPHPQIMQLRFDEERSNPADLPVHVRKKIYPLLAKYADGITHRVNKQWEKTTLQALQLDQTPYKPLSRNG